MSSTTKDVNNCMNREARSGAAFGDLSGATDAYGEKPTSATVTNAFPVVNVGDADLAQSDACASDVPARDFLNTNAKYLLQ